MAFLCPSRVGRAAKNKTNKAKVPRLGGRLTGSDSIDSLVRVGLKRQHNFKPESKLIITQDFKARVDEELDVYRGQEVYFLYEENEWTYVLTDDDKEGFVPSVLCSKFSDISPTSVTTLQEEDRKSSGDVKSESSSSSVKKFSDPSFETDSERWSEFSKLSSSSLKVETFVQDVRWFRKTSHGQYIVLFNFTALDENDISVERAELVEVLNIEDPEWSWIRRYNGEEGFVPKSYICPVEPLLAQEKIHLSHGKNSQRNMLKSQPPQNLLALDHKNERSLVYSQGPSNDSYPLTDAAKRENIALSSAVQRQQQFIDSSNRKPSSPTPKQTAELLKPKDIKEHKHSNQTKFVTADIDKPFPSSNHNFRDGTNNTSPHPNVTKTKHFIENVPPDELSKQDFDKYRTAINAEIKQLGLLKKVSNSSNPDSNLVPSRNNIKTLSNDPGNHVHGQQSDINYNNQSKHITKSESSNDIMERGSSPVRRTSPFRFKNSLNNEEGKFAGHENYMKDPVRSYNGPNNRERGESPSRPKNDSSYRSSSPLRTNNAASNRGASPVRTNTAASNRGASPVRTNIAESNRGASDVKYIAESNRGTSDVTNIAASNRGTSPVRTNIAAGNRGASSVRTKYVPDNRGTSPVRQNFGSNFGTTASNLSGNETTCHGRQDSEISHSSVNNALKSCDITEFILLYDYTAQSKNDLTVKRGDIVYVDTTDQDDQQWLWVYCPQWHKYGYVPRSYVKVPMKTTL